MRSFALFFVFIAGVLLVALDVMLEGGVANGPLSWFGFGLIVGDLANIGIRKALG